MTDPIELRTGGPHSPEYTAEVADAAAEAIRVLNHATGGFDALVQPADVDRLLSALSAMASRLPQLFLQTQANLVRIADDAALYDDRGNDPSATVALVSMGLGAAHGAAMALFEALDAAHNASAHLGSRDGFEGET
jgi:hypothetical protein